MSRLEIEYKHGVFAAELDRVSDVFDRYEILQYLKGERCFVKDGISAESIVTLINETNAKLAQQGLSNNEIQNLKLTLSGLQAMLETAKKQGR